MELEKEISQERFSTDYHKAAVNIIFTYNWLISNMKDRYDDEGVTIQQYNILRILRGQSGKAASINLLKSRMLDRMSDASRIVERLVQKKLVKKSLNSCDKRSVDIHISESGLELLLRLDGQSNIENKLEKNLNKTEIIKLNNLLDKLRG